MTGLFSKGLRFRADAGIWSPPAAPFPRVAIPRTSVTNGTDESTRGATRPGTAWLARRAWRSPSRRQDGLRSGCVGMTNRDDRQTDKRGQSPGTQKSQKTLQTGELLQHRKPGQLPRVLHDPEGHRRAGTQAGGRHRDVMPLADGAVPRAEHERPPRLVHGVVGGVERPFRTGLDDGAGANVRIPASPRTGSASDRPMGSTQGPSRHSGSARRPNSACGKCRRRYVGRSGGSSSRPVPLKKRFVGGSSTGSRST